MDAPLLRTLVWVICALALGANTATAASVRSENFIVNTPSAELAEKVARRAEQFRKELALEWLGYELPRWSQPCPIEVKRDPKLGAGGATTFSFNRGHVFGWTMEIQGPDDHAILESVLPHEVNHTVFATHFGQPLPRWADEGACGTVEHIDERRRMEKRLRHFLQNQRGIAFNRMFAMREYPRDVLPLYAQGYSLVSFLVEQGGRQKFVKYVGFGLETNDWNAATQRFYGYKSLGDLQTVWVDWVGRGSPTPLPTDIGPNNPPQLADAGGNPGQPPRPSTGSGTPRGQGEMVPIQRPGQNPQATPPREPAPDRVTPNGQVVMADQEPGWVAIGPRYGRSRSGRTADEAPPATAYRERPPSGEVLLEWSGRDDDGRRVR